MDKYRYSCGLEIAPRKKYHFENLVQLTKEMLRKDNSKLNKPETEIITLYPDTTLSHLMSGPTITVKTKFQISDNNM